MLFSDRGVLQGLLTKKDVWYILNGAEETRKTDGTDMNTGLTREDGEGEARGLLNRDGDSRDTTPTSPGEREPIL